LRQPGPRIGPLPGINDKWVPVAGDSEVNSVGGQVEACVIWATGGAAHARAGEVAEARRDEASGPLGDGGGGIGADSQPRGGVDPDANVLPDGDGDGVVGQFDAEMLGTIHDGRDDRGQPGTAVIAVRGGEGETDGTAVEVGGQGDGVEEGGGGAVDVRRVEQMVRGYPGVDTAGAEVLSPKGCGEVSPSGTVQVARAKPRLGGAELHGSEAHVAQAIEGASRLGVQRRQRGGEGGLRVVGREGIHRDQATVPAPVRQARC